MAQDKYTDDAGKQFELISIEVIDDPAKTMEQLVALDNEEDRMEKYGEQQLAHLYGAHTIAAQLPQGAGALLSYLLAEVCDFGDANSPAGLADLLFKNLPANVVHGISQTYFQPQGQVADLTDEQKMEEAKKIFAVDAGK